MESAGQLRSAGGATFSRKSVGVCALFGTAVVVILSDVIGGDGKSLVEHGRRMAGKEGTNETIVLLANDALTIELLSYCLAGPYLAASTVMGEQLFGIVAPSDVIGTAKAWAAGT